MIANKMYKTNNKLKINKCLNKPRIKKFLVLLITSRSHNK